MARPDWPWPNRVARIDQQINYVVYCEINGSLSGTVMALGNEAA